MAAVNTTSEEADQQAVQKATTTHIPIMGPMVSLYPVSCIKKRTKGKQFEKDRSVADRFARYERQYYEEGIRRTVDAVLLVHDHGHPHVLMLHIDHKFWKLPGGKMKAGESEIDCLKRKLDRRLAPEASSGLPAPEWKVVDLAGAFYRPNFEQAIYPYPVPHVSETKEVKKLFVVTLTGECVFEYPANYGIELVPLMDLMDNAKRFGPVAAAIPFLLSRFQFICLDQQQ